VNLTRPPLPSKPPREPFYAAVHELHKLDPWSAQIELTFVPYLSEEGDDRTLKEVAEETLAEIVSRSTRLLAGRGELRVIDLEDPALSSFACEQGCGRETPVGCAQPDCSDAGKTFEPDVVLGFRAADRNEAEQTVEALLDALNGGFDNAVTFDRDGRRQPERVATFNTRLTWRYGDANNYRTSRSVVLEGEPTPETMAALRGGLFEGESFIPSQVGLPDLQGELQAYDSEKSLREYERHRDLDPDHPWHDIEATIGEHIELTADPPDDIELTATAPGTALGFAELASRMSDTTWDDTIPVR
jgi:hypothetical protein